MCGLFGYSGSKPCNPLAISLLALDNEVRGYDSTGLYSKEKGLWKIADKATIAVRVKAFQEHTQDSTLVIGHTRAGTHGIKTAENAHPFLWKLDDGRAFALAHNGWIINVKEHAAALGIDEREYRVDSQLYGLHFLRSKFSLKAIHEDIQAAAALSFFFENRLYLYRKTSKPLYVAPIDGGIVYSSRQDGLKLIGAWDNITMLTPDVFYAFEDGELVDTYYFGKSKITLPLDCAPSQWAVSIKADERKLIPGEKAVIYNEEVDDAASKDEMVASIIKAQPYLNNRGKKAVDEGSKAVRDGGARELATTSLTHSCFSKGRASSLIVRITVTGKTDKKERWYAWMDGDTTTAIRLYKQEQGPGESREFVGCIELGILNVGSNKNVIIFNGADKFSRKGVWVQPRCVSTVKVSINVNMLIAARDQSGLIRMAGKDDLKTPLAIAADCISQVRIADSEHVRFHRANFPEKLMRGVVEAARLTFNEKKNVADTYVRETTQALVAAEMSATASSILAAYANLSKITSLQKMIFIDTVAAMLEFCYGLDGRFDDIMDEYYEDAYHGDRGAFANKNLDFAYNNGADKDGDGITLSFLSGLDGKLQSASVYGEHRPLAEKLYNLDNILQEVEKECNILESALKPKDEFICEDDPEDMEKTESEDFDVRLADNIKSFDNLRIMFHNMEEELRGLRDVFTELEEEIPNSEAGKSDFIMGIVSVKKEITNVFDDAFNNKRYKEIREGNYAIQKFALEKILSSMFDIDTYVAELSKILCEDLEISDVLPF